ncbi:hypothetical protein RHSIM_Rhsim02G0046000 [Rhododendron simsii]|uniref:EF-hand domain-containing protein n=1 Tax=Rhododendron simsii TaxID=118357 RepID=A0A834HKQ8_RHOSS|nr:hypothetical protein RHSIM_Rhsim02G0046000 [Rhododendron simsii]
MEDLVKTARLYYSKSSPEVKRAAEKYFNSLDDNKDGKVSFNEFLRLMRQEGHTKMSNRHFFKEMDKDGSGTLEFMEVMALYYVIKSGRPFCSWCDEFIPGMYFTCTKCFENDNNSFFVCPKCFEETGSDRFDHEHDQFLDNYALLETMRLQRIANHSNQHKPSSSVTITELYPTSTTNAIVRYEQPKPRPWDRRLRILDSAIVGAVGNLCTILSTIPCERFTGKSPHAPIFSRAPVIINNDGDQALFTDASSTKLSRAQPVEAEPVAGDVLSFSQTGMERKTGGGVADWFMRQRWWKSVSAECSGEYIQWWKWCKQRGGREEKGFGFLGTLGMGRRRREGYNGKIRCI